jgi:tRNA A37 threonylcarbamoyladenosine modification protein TsaB
MTLLINPLADPLQIGCYEDDGLVCRRTPEGKASEGLLPALEEMLERYEVTEILYASGPGSYMAIKLTYITLATLAQLRGIPFGAVSAFALNGGRPIRAMGLMYFVKEKETIITQKMDEPIPQIFELPERLDRLERLDDRTPQYVLPAV